MTGLVTGNGFQEPPRSVREIKEQLADLAKVKAKAEAYGTPDFASQIAWQSLLAQEQSLLEELRAAESPVMSPSDLRTPEHTDSR